MNLLTTFIINKGGEPRYAVVPIHEFKELLKKSRDAYCHCSA